MPFPHLSFVFHPTALDTSLSNFSHSIILFFSSHLPFCRSLQLFAYPSNDLWICLFVFHLTLLSILTCPILSYLFLSFPIYLIYFLFYSYLSCLFFDRSISLPLSFSLYLLQAGWAPPNLDPMQHARRCTRKHAKYDVRKYAMLPVRIYENS